MTTPSQRLAITRVCIYAYSTSIHGWGIEGQLSELHVEGKSWTCTAWVRERGHSLRGGSFYESSGLRHGARIRGDDVGTLQVLELCAPASRWGVIAELVAEADAHGRPVKSCRLFTRAWAEWQFQRCTPLPLRHLPGTTYTRQPAATRRAA